MTIVRYAGVIFVAALMAVVVALSVSTVEPERAEAATNVRTCGGGTIKLNAKEERTLRLHNQERRSRGLRALCVHPKLTKRSEEHTSELQSRQYLVCRLLLEKKKTYH